ncbi:AraC-like DNA-binding protein [Rhizobium leguminosarum]|uniref:AraC-like DNA-binding protein n=1 Tax=Rhizobium leguminosarum TaxID=384 RepID=A0AAE2MNW0_RHILE|nr:MULTISPECIES: helix-turn-helix transcriptional regulator [Rhizobium]MBB4292674.1 AraC-like DNA-binding protein [Rhizobium leguminosarum]MBB4298912.1 AraC-like DNA-binding protein [Rhizobium leguminosarum]MBB4310115.1 AraC-like DNA-binding protein [Rhizobium leguminosarum]MBB4434377.1 AraC-like DNA-binding protein [Rhizobium esperanzae]MBB4531273.1 AraC-like DNA-binding protein [Rhizobium leguminosarum]
MGDLENRLSTLCMRSEVDLEGSEQVAFNVHGINSNQISIIAGTYWGNLKMRHRNPSESNIVLLPLCGRSIVTVNGQRVLSEGTRGAFVSSMSDNALHFVGTRKHLGLKISEQVLSQRLGLRLDTSVRGRIDFSPEIDLATGPGSFLVRLAELMYSGLADRTLVQAPLALVNLTNTILELLLDATQHRYSSELLRTVQSPMPRTVKRAIDYMRAHIDQPIMISDVAQAAGVSPRTLQQGFRDFRHTTPMAFLQHLRLDAVHQELSQGVPGQTVKKVAQKWGFVHASRFAAEYRNRFGEFPSETMRKSGIASLDWLG